MITPAPPSTIQMVDLQTQYAKIKTEVLDGINQVLETGAFINGPIVQQFSTNLAKYLDVKYAIPCANGTDALQVALMALNLQPGDEIITPSFTFVATAEVIALLGLKPVFVDINPKTFTIDTNQLQKLITPKTKCIIPVHLYGQSADMQSIMDIAERHNLYVIEDNAQAIGADCAMQGNQYKKTGTIGHIGCTSFYPSKNLGAYGDAGAIFTNDNFLFDRIQAIANHGQKVKYSSEYVGINSRLDSFQAVVLNAKLKHLDEYTRARQKAAAFYDQAFKNNPNLTTPYRAAYSTHVFHQYTLILENADRDTIKTQLENVGIPTMIYYPIPIHLQKAYQYCQYQKGDLPVSERMAHQTLSLPMHTELTTPQLEYIAEQVLELVSQ